jgi:ATP-dependent DNA helicase RecG
MPEDQNIEHKSSWHDDWLKIICGFANAKGGRLQIGKDDNGNIVGLTNTARLMEDIPNKIKNHLGIIAETNLSDEPPNNFIEVVVPEYSVAISYHGRYYLRTGSTTSELTGNSLNDFLLKRSGRTWDDLFEERAFVDDLDMSSQTKFLNAAEKSGRISIETDIERTSLLEKLRLSDNKKIKRAAIILFAKDAGKFYSNISVKIGRFGKSDDDLKFQEVIEGNLFKILFEVPEMLNNKFLTKRIDFEGFQRIEKGEYPVAALREMLLNALVHKNYSGAQIQLRVYDDKISIWNEGSLPEGLSFEALKRQHPSRPRNPLIADVCFKGGYIDAWGRGTLKIINSCKEAGLPEPEFIGIDGGVLVTIFKDIYSEDQLKKLGLNERQIKAVLFVKENGKVTNKEYRDMNNLSDEGARIDLNDLIDKNILIAKGSGRSAHYVLKKLGN